jgi:hypothetical protein
MKGLKMFQKLVFKIHPEVIFLKINEKIAYNIITIVQNVVGFVSAPCRADEKVEIEPIKEIIMEDFKIFFKDSILSKL